MTTESLSKETATSSSAIRLGALSLVLSGILLLLYPALRPFSDEAGAETLQGAEAFASPFWILAHTLAAVGFILLALGLVSLRIALQKTAGERLASVAWVVTWIGVGLSLLYYGAESFALHAIGQQAVAQHSTQILTLVNAIRYGPAIFVFAGGFYCWQLVPSWLRLRCGDPARSHDGVVFRSLWDLRSTFRSFSEPNQSELLMDSW
jgi:hypothetical protein